MIYILPDDKYATAMQTGLLQGTPETEYKDSPLSIIPDLSIRSGDHLAIRRV
jgi:hypothetical protein